MIKKWPIISCLILAALFSAVFLLGGCKKAGGKSAAPGGTSTAIKTQSASLSKTGKSAAKTTPHATASWIVDDKAFSNGSNVAIKDGWLYYVNVNDRNRLYKIRTDGSGNVKMSEDQFAGLYISGEWLYFTDKSENDELRRMKLDGSGMMKVSDDLKYGTYKIFGDMIFYTANYDNNLHAVESDGANAVTLGDRFNACNISAQDGWIYYINIKENNKIYKIKFDGSGDTRLNEAGSGDLTIKDGWLYYTNNTFGNTIYKMKLDGSQNTKLSDSDAHIIGVDGEWLYYTTTAEANIYRMRTDGTGVAKLTDEDSSGAYVYGDRIFYFKDNQFNILYSMQKDGSAHEQFLKTGNDVRSEIDSIPVVTQPPEYKPSGAQYDITLGGLKLGDTYARLTSMYDQKYRRSEYVGTSSEGYTLSGKYFSFRMDRATDKIMSIHLASSGYGGLPAFDIDVGDNAKNALAALDAKLARAVVRANVQRSTYVCPLTDGTTTYIKIEYSDYHMLDAEIPDDSYITSITIGGALE